MVNSKRWRPETNTSNLCWSTHKTGINFNSLKIQSVSKVTPSIHKNKEALDLSATDGRGVNILGGKSMAIFSVVSYLITVLNFDSVKKTTRHATVKKENLIQ
jgi:hypothetical protein